MGRMWGVVAVGLIAGLAVSCKAGPSSGKTARKPASEGSFELKGSRLVGCCCSPPCS